MTKTSSASRLTVEFNEDLTDTLADIAESQGVSKAAVIRRSLALMKYFEEASARGEHIGLIDESGQVIREILLT